MRADEFYALLGDHLYELDHRRNSICSCGFVPRVDPNSLWTQQDYHRAHLAMVLERVAS